MELTRKAQAKLPTKYGEFTIIVYEISEHEEHVALVFGEIKGIDNVLVRLHSECLTGDAFFSKKCDCGEQLEAAMHKISKENGAIIYLRQEGRGIGLLNKIRAYELQEQGYDTVEANEKLGFHADSRDYTVGAKIIKELGLSTIRLLTNNPRKITGLEKLGIHIVERIPLVIKSNVHNEKYFETKKEKLGHKYDKEGFVNE